MENRDISKRGNNDMKNSETSKRFRISELNLESIESIDVEQYKKINVLDLGTTGMGIESVFSAINQIQVGKQGGTGIYRVTVPNGTHMAQFKNGKGFMGGCLKANNQVGGGQAVITPIMFNPTMLYMTLAFEGINRKLDAIEAMQKEIFDYLKDRDESSIKGNLEMLQDVYKQYEYNASNINWKDSYRVKVVDVKHESLKYIEMYRRQIEKKVEKNKPNWVPRIGKQVEKPFAAIKKDFTYYKLALYIYSFASFLEVMLVENFSEGYLNEISDKLEHMVMEYKELYTMSYNMLEKQYDHCVGAMAVKSTAKAEKTLGKVLKKTNNVMEKAAEKAPVKVNIELNKNIPEKIRNIGEFEFNKALLESGEKLNKYQERQINMAMQEFTELKNSSVRPFIENINNVNKIFNNPVDLIVEKERIYIGVRNS